MQEKRALAQTFIFHAKQRFNRSLKSQMKYYTYVFVFRTFRAYVATEHVHITMEYAHIATEHVHIVSFRRFTLTGIHSQILYLRSS